MRKKWKKKAAAFMAAVMLFGAAEPFSQSANADTNVSAKGMEAVQIQADTAQAYRSALQPEMEKNLNYQNYGVYGGMVSSYLVAQENGYMRLQHVKEEGTQKLVVEYYNEQFQLQSQQYIAKQLDGFAGFYAGSDYYYIAWVQSVSLYAQGGWSKDKTFLRVVKYDKNWKELALVDINSADKKGVGVVYPCESGSLRMTEYQGHLYINTCFEDVYTHQSSMMFDILEKDMTLVKPEVNPLDSYYGSASHSFNQYLLVDDGLSPKRMVTLNQGDNAAAGKRGAALEQCVLYTEYPQASSADNKKLVNVFPCAGSSDNNFVGISLGGLEQSKTSYLTAGNSIEQTEETFLTAKQRNIFVTATSRTNFSKENTSVTWLTNYKEGDGVEISTPQLVKMNDNLFLVMWRVGEQEDHRAGELRYVFVDADGKRCSGTLGQTKTAGAEITDCKPIVKDGKAIWYSSGKEGVYFYSIDAQGNFAKHGVNTMEKVPKLTKVQLREDGIYYEWEPVANVAGYRIIRRYATGIPHESLKFEYEICDVMGAQSSNYLDEKSFPDCRSYDFFVCALNEDGVPGYGSNIISQFLFRGIWNANVRLSNAANGVKVEWGAYYKASEYRIYRSSADGTDRKRVATVDGREEESPIGKVESYVDTTAQSGTAYDYSVSVVCDGKESVIFNKHSIIYLSTPKVNAKSTVHNGRNTVTLSWGAVLGAEKYTVSTEVWDEASGSYTSVNLGKSMSEDSLSCVVYGAVEGKKYRFSVKAWSKTIQTSSMQYSNSFSSEIEKTELAYVRPDAPAPTAPAFTLVGNGENGVNLAWTPSEGADGYELRRQGQIVKVLSDTEYTDTNVTEGTTYTYQVRMYVQNGSDKVYSDWSAQQSITFKKSTTPSVKLQAPSLTTVENTEEGVKLSWTLVEGASGYEVNAYDESQGSRTVIRKETECVDARAAEGTAYTYKVRAYVQNGNAKTYSDWSTPRNITRKKPTTASEIRLQAPVINSLESTEEGVKLAWNPIEGAGGYEIEIRNAGSQTARKVSLDASLNVAEYVDGKAVDGTSYAYKIRAYAKDGSVTAYSDWSAEKSVTFKKPTQEAKLPAPKITSIQNTADGVKLTWDAVEGAKKYWIYYYNPSTDKFQVVEAVSETYFVDKKVEEGKTYYYAIYAWTSKDGKSYFGERSKTVGIQYEKPKPTPPAAPVLKKLTCLKEGVQVEWEPVEGANGYYVYYYEVSGLGGSAGSYRRIEGGSAKSAVVPYVSGAEGKTYCYYVVAYNSVGQSEKSNIESIVIRIPGSDTPTPTPTPTLPAPNLKSVTCFKDEYGSGIELVWDPVEGADGYILFAYEDGEARMSQEKEGGKTCNHHFYDLKEGAAYSFFLMAYKKVNGEKKNGAFSEVKSIIFKTPSDKPEPTPTPTPGPEPEPDKGLAVPKNVRVKCVRGGVKVAWDPVEGADGYILKYYDAGSPASILPRKLEGRNTVSFLDVYVTEGQTYVYSVAAYKNGESMEESEYSQEVSIRYSKSDVNLGDVNGDGKVTIEDAIGILKDVARLNNPGFVREAADCDMDNKVTVNDALLVLKHVAKIMQL